MEKTKKYVLPIVIVAAMLVSALTTSLIMVLTSRNKVPEGYVPAGYISIEDAQALIAAITLPVGSMNMEFQEVSEAEANEITSGIEEIQRDPLAGTVAVKVRDWSQYSSRIAKESMTFDEKVLYDRYDECCKRYLERAIDGYKSASAGKSGDYFYYGEAVSFKDLSLTLDQAQSLFYWFKFNNPQYYFLLNGAAFNRSTKQMFPMMYGSFMKGDKRAETTNALFDKLDEWIASISDDEVTTWQKELSANELLCTKLVYDENEPFYQSLYSAVMLERTVCAGYSEAFCAMMNAVGVDAMVALNDVHAWNMVRFDDGKYYVVDVLWNENDRNDRAPLTDYFNCGERTAKSRDTELAEHTLGSDVAAWAPVLSQTDYSPTEYDRMGSATNESTVTLSVPKGLRVVDDKDRKVYIEWDPVDQATGYTIEIYDGAMTEKLNGGQVTGSSVSVTYSTRTSFAVRVRAEAEVDGETYLSDWSEFLSVKTADPVQPSAEPSASTVQLAAPANVKIIKDEATVTHFSWDRVENADQYQVILFKDAGYKETWLTSFREEPTMGYASLTPNTTYYYGVRAMKTVDGKDWFSSWTYFEHTTPAKESSSTTLTKPAAPTNVKTVSTGERSTLTTWDPVSGATGYQIDLYKDRDYEQFWVEFSSTSTSLELEKMTKGVTYYYTVRAVKSVDGVELYSDPVKASYTHMG